MKNVVSQVLNPQLTYKRPPTHSTVFTTVTASQTSPFELQPISPSLQYLKTLSETIIHIQKKKMSAPAQVIINGVTFSKYELEVSCAIKLWIKNANNAVPSDETLGYIVNSLRGNAGTSLPCQNVVPQIQRHSQEVVRSIYMSVYVNKSYWGREASRVYYAWLKQNDNIVRRLVSQLLVTSNQSRMVGRLTWWLG